MMDPVQNKTVLNTALLRITTTSMHYQFPTECTNHTIDNNNNYHAVLVIRLHGHSLVLHNVLYMLILYIGNSYNCISFMTLWHVFIYY